VDNTKKFFIFQWLLNIHKAQKLPVLQCRMFYCLFWGVSSSIGKLPQELDCTASSNPESSNKSIYIKETNRSEESKKIHTLFFSALTCYQDQYIVSHCTKCIVVLRNTRYTFSQLCRVCTAISDKLPSFRLQHIKQLKQITNTHSIRT